MDPVFLTFNAPHLEKHYTTLMFGGLKNNARLATWTCFVLRSVIVVGVLAGKAVSTPVEAAIVGFSWLTPFMENYITKQWTDSWFVDWGEWALVMSGSFQCLSLCYLLNLRGPIGQEVNTSALLRLAIGCLPLMEIKIACWHRLRFKRHIFLTLATTLICSLGMEKPACSMMAKEFSSFLQDFMQLINMMSAQLPLHAQGSSENITWLTEERACDVLITFSHVFLGFFVLTYIVWMMERETRLEFIRVRHRDFERSMPPSMRLCIEHVVLVILTMPLAWSIALVGQRIMVTWHGGV